jgi:hypothetical protein
VAHVQRHDVAGAVLQQAVREASGRSAHIEAEAAIDGDSKVGKRAGELVAPARDVAFHGSAQPNDGGGGDAGPRLVVWDVVDQDFARADESLSEGSRLSETISDEALVESLLPGFFQGRISGSILWSRHERLRRAS